MYKKAISSLLIFSLLFTLTLPTFAQAADQSNKEYTITENDIEKQVVEFGDNVKLIAWEDENEMIFEQYDAKNVLFDRVVVEKESKTATSTYNDSIGAGEIKLEAPETVQAIQPRVFNRIDTVKVQNPLTFPTTIKNMYVYENYTKKLTTYTIPSGVKTVAQLGAAIAVGLAVGANIGGLILSAVVAAGAGFIADKTVNMFFNLTVAAERRSYEYYGKDTVSSKISKNFQWGTKFVVKDEDSKYINKVYTTADTYKDSSSAKYQINNALCANIYGANFEYTLPI